jgi:hypothetical protein
MTTFNGASVSLPAGSVGLAELTTALKETSATEIAAAPKAEAEITESAAGNGVKEPSATKPTWVYVKFIAKEDKKASMKIEVGAVIVYEYEDTAVVALKQTQTASFLVPKAVKFTVTFSECEKIIPTYHTL